MAKQHKADLTKTNIGVTAGGGSIGGARAALKPAAKPAAADQKDRFNVLSPYQFQRKGETKTGWTEVGAAFASKDGQGVNIELRPGISVSGRLVLRPWSSTDGGNSDDDGGPRRFVYDGRASAEDLV